MKAKDFDGVLTRAFNKKLNVDATPRGKSFVKYFSFNGAEKEVFLGGTCNESEWRDELVKHLKLPYFNPVVDDWNDVARIAEEEAKLRCGIHLYVITPKMTGVFAIAEAVKSAMVNPKGTFFVAVYEDGEDRFSQSQIKSIKATSDMISDLGSETFVMPTVKGLIYVAKEINKVKRGFASTVVIQLQSHPIKFGGVHGIQHYDMLNIVKAIIQFFNDKFGSVYNMETIHLLNKAKERQEARTADRKVRKVEGYDKD